MTWRTVLQRTAAEWLFKYPREGTGEHWAEKIAAEVASALGVDHATAELAVFEGQEGVALRSFVADGEELVHGNQLMEIAVNSYNPEAGFRYRRHSLTNILECLGLLSRFTKSDLATTKRLFAGYLLLDALVGNTDRHHENWGLSLGRERGLRLAPSFDHGSSLGRELRDERRSSRLTDDRVAAYLRRGRGGVYWSEDEAHGPSPLELFRLASRRHPSVFLPALGRLDRLGGENVREAVDRVPEGWMSQPARDFACKLMETSIEQLRRMDS